MRARQKAPCKFLTQAGVDAGTQAPWVAQHPMQASILLPAWHGQPSRSTCSLCLGRPLAITLLGFSLVYWCASGGGWGGTATYATSPCLRPAGQGRALARSLSHYHSLKPEPVPWDLMDRVSECQPITLTMGSNFLGDVSTIWDGISMCWWRSAAFLIFYWPRTFGLCAVEILGW